MHLLKDSLCHKKLTIQTDSTDIEWEKRSIVVFISQVGNRIMEALRDHT